MLQALHHAYVEKVKPSSGPRLAPIAELLSRFPQNFRQWQIRRPLARSGVVRVGEVVVDVLLQGQLRTEPHAAAGNDALVGLGTAVGLHVPVQPLATAGLLVVHLAAVPEAHERAGLAIDVLDLQMVLQMPAGVELGVAFAPVAHAEEAPVREPPEAFPAELVVGTVEGREADGFRLRQDWALGALGHGRGIQEVRLDAGWRLQQVDRSG